MSYDVRIIADSLSSRQYRLTTIEVTLPRIVLAEFNTHRVFSRNSASSRAIPVEKMLKRVQEDPFIPVYWGKNQKGMQASEELSDLIDQAGPDGSSSPRSRAQIEWLLARDNAVTTVKRLQMPDIDLHKQIANRLLEPWLWHTIIVSSTEWDNYFALRTHKDAQPEIRKAAVVMKEAYDASIPINRIFTDPETVNHHAWHLPLVPDAVELLGEGFTINDLRLISVGRCARVSYLTHNGTREPAADIDLAKKLQAAGHMSPFEHVARPMTFDELHTFNPQTSNFKGWLQYRKTLPNEDNFMKTLTQRVG